jgi:hypothetical protein
MKGKKSGQHSSLNWFVIRKCLIYFEEIHTKNYEANSGVGAARYRMFNNSTFPLNAKGMHGLLFLEADDSLQRL